MFKLSTGKDASVGQSSASATVLAIPDPLSRNVDTLLDESWNQVRPRLRAAINGFLLADLMPLVLLQFELELLACLRDFGRELLQRTLNACEPADARQLPHDLVFQGGGYRRLGRKTCNAHIATLFGTITLWRFGYRYWHRDPGEPAIFPLELKLGLIHGTTPALANRIGEQMAEAGATQQRVVKFLRQEHGVAMGIGRLRQVTAAVAEGMGEFRCEQQVQQLLAALRRASEKPGNRKPNLCVGRDGITLCEYKHRFYEVASVATITVYDRCGKRLQTVYLAHPPEENQTSLSSMLTEVIQGVLAAWEGPLPELTYVSDSGQCETGYFRNVLSRMRHPRTGKRLKWLRIADFYHAAERVWQMADALFGPKTPAANSWARRMLKQLKKPSGVSRVLHSAASHFARRTLSKSRQDDYHKAYRYIQSRSCYMRYADYQRRRLAIGSGVTEAACKTLFTQRLKLSGMRWSKQGAASIVGLRSILLSGTWPATFAAYLTSLTPARMAPYTTQRSANATKPR